MSEIFFTSDLHLNHDKEFLYTPRGFSSIDEHDNAIICNWNSDITNNDIIHVCGDITMGADYESSLEKLSSLNGKLILYRGNHDTDMKWERYATLSNVEVRPNYYADIIKLGKWSLLLSHRPTIMGDFQCIKHGHKSFNLHGHTHSKDKFEFLQFCCYNVALDAHNNRPVNWSVVQEDLRFKMQEFFNAKNKE